MANQVHIKRLKDTGEVILLATEDIKPVHKVWLDDNLKGKSFDTLIAEAPKLKK